MMISILPCDAVREEEIFALRDGAADVSDTVADILRDVRENGDAALLRYTEKFDRAKITGLTVSKEEIDRAVDSVGKKYLAVLEEATENIRAFHMRQVRSSFLLEGSDGVLTGQKVMPIERVGVYVPGGTAAYPSTVLMNVIPAKIAGVREIIVVTPPTGGAVNPAILAAARVCGADRVFQVGGAQAIGALAYGTESIPKVDKIVGPGNAYVAEAKKQVFGRVSIDMIAGPSEILVVADGASDPRHVAADLLSQAEHDKNAAAVLVTESKELAEAVQAELSRQLQTLPRREIAEASIEKYGRILLVGSVREGVELANRLAPEHLELCVDDPFSLLGAVKNAGSVFLGRNCPEALGDYFAGPNHTLPTGGTARFSSPLSVDDFVKKTQFISYTRDALSRVAEKVQMFAEREGLCAHARSVSIRLEENAK